VQERVEVRLIASGQSQGSEHLEVLFAGDCGPTVNAVKLMSSGSLDGGIEAGLVAKQQNVIDGRWGT
jgi:hypothetical protein